MDLFTLVLFCGAFVTLLLAYIAWLRRHAAGALALMVMMLSAGWWLVCEALPFAGLSDAEEIFLRARLIFPGVVLITPATLVFALAFTSPTGRVERRWLAALAIEPIIVLTAVALPSLHDAFYGSWRGRVEDGMFRGGPLFWAHSLYCYVVLGKCLQLLGRHYLFGAVLQRRQTAYILFAIIIPVVCNFTSVLGLLPENRDLTPLGLATAGILLSLAIFSRGLLDLIVIARGKINEVVTDGMLVIDSRRRIIDSSPAMWTIFDLPRPSREGDFLQEALPELNENFNRDVSGTTRIEFTSELGRHLELRVFPLGDERPELCGHVLLVRDITEAKNTAIALEVANQTLRFQLTKIEEMQKLLSEQVIRDPLTGLYNRRHLDEVLHTELRQSGRTGAHFALVMIDIDHFKGINDNYGHAAGDTVLRALGTLLLQRSRPTDAPCRYGGEEFVVVMSAATIDAATRRVDEWRAEFSRLDQDFDGVTVNTTFSAGVAVFPADGGDASALLNAADSALYAAKAAGRNMVRCAGTCPATA